MSHKTLYFCDKCSKEADNKELTNVRLELDAYSSYKTKRFDRVYQYFNICDECAEKLGFILKKVEEANVVVEPTTAEKLYDIIAQMIMEIQR